MVTEKTSSQKSRRRRPSSPATEAQRPHGVGAPDQRLETTLDGLRQLLRRAYHQELEPDDWPLVCAFISNQVTRIEQRQQRMLAKIAADEAKDAKADLDENDPSVGPSPQRSCSSESSSGEPEPAYGDDKQESEPGNSNTSKGHGRNGAGAFRKAQHFSHRLALGVLGAMCQRCKLSKMLAYREKVVVRIIGQPLFGAEVHHYEQARCRECGNIVRAEGPACVHEGFGSDYVRYDWSAGAMLTVMHYSGGAPFKRMESLHAGWGVPMSDANQWEVVNKADDLLLPLHKALEHHAVLQATNFRIDDTGSMVIELKKQINAELAALQRLGESTKDVRTGINATGSYWETPNGPVILFYTGRHHAGEVIDDLLRHRQRSSSKLVKCTDGASKNFDHQHADKLVEATCNAHALLKFRGIKDKYPAEYAVAGSVYKQVFDNDDKAKALDLTPVERMRFHRQYSKPLMQELKNMCIEKVKSRLVEPNSLLWEPVSFIINQWDRLTRFCEVPGVPLDSNLVEQALIMPVRYLAGSFNYHTENGAAVGDRFMSLIATARAHDIDPVAYLTECLRCHDDLKKRPEHYVPWVYRERLAQQRDSTCDPEATSHSAA